MVCQTIVYYVYYGRAGLWAKPRGAIKVHTDEPAFIPRLATWANASSMANLSDRYRVSKVCDSTDRMHCFFFVVLEDSTCIIP